MNCAICGQLYCVCVTPGSTPPDPHARPIPPKHAYRPLGKGEYLTKEQFGLNLYEAIKTIGGILGLDQQRAACIHRERSDELPDLLARREKLVKDFVHHRAILTHDERQQILARYPWVRDL